MLAPLSGRVVALSDVPDPVFADEIVGPGIAIEPAPAESVLAFAPISGRIAKLFPHAFAIARPHDAVLVHLGLDTMKLKGEGFTLHSTEGEEVAAGDPITEWHLNAFRARGLNCIVPVIAVGIASGCLTQLHEPGSLINAGDPLFNLEE